MAKKKDAPVGEFAVSLHEFVATIRINVEATQAFSMLMKFENNTTHRLKSEWTELYNLFLTKPTGTPWKEWADKKKGGQ